MSRKSATRKCDKETKVVESEAADFELFARAEGNYVSPILSKYLRNCLSMAYNLGYIDALEKVRKDKIL